MNINSLKIFSVISILLLLLNACAKPNIKTNKKFKHNTPLIKDDIRKSGKMEIDKTIKMGPKPVIGDTKALQKRKKISSQQKRNYLLIPDEFQSLKQIVSFKFKNLDYAEAMQLMGKVGDINVLVGDEVAGSITAELVNVPWDKAFNALLDKNSQIIISADRPPNKLTRIQERIKSRFSGGLVVDIQNPDYELRYKIIKSKTDELKLSYSNQVVISEEIQKFLSTEIKTSIRELVGALNRIVSFTRIYNKVPNLSEVKIVLKDLLNLTENKVDIDTIQTIVCKFYKISKNEMLSPRRSRYLVRPRQTAIYLSKMLTSKSLPEIGRSFSNRDHTTVIHSVKTIERLRKEDSELNINIDSLKNKILYNKENEV